MTSEQLQNVNKEFKTKSLRGIIGLHVYPHKCNFDHVVHRTYYNNENFTNIMSVLVSDFGVPEHLTVDGSSVQVVRMTLSFKLIYRQEIKCYLLTPRKPNDNTTEGSIR